MGHPVNILWEPVRILGHPVNIHGQSVRILVCLVEHDMNLCWKSQLRFNLNIFWIFKIRFQIPCFTIAWSYLSLSPGSKPGSRILIKIGVLSPIQILVKKVNTLVKKGKYFGEKGKYFGEKGRYFGEKRWILWWKKVNTLVRKVRYFDKEFSWKLENIHTIVNCFNNWNCRF